jgi:outer membrane lipoprotein-sorting protein
VGAEPTAAVGDDKLMDYRGKGEVTIALDEAPGMEPVTLTLQMEQVFRKPSTIMLTLNLFGAGLRQTFLTDATGEQSYNPVQGVIVEKRYKNLEKSPTSPLIALQASMYDFGRKVRTAQSRRPVGTESLLGHSCDVVELESKELFQDIATSGLLGGQRGDDLRNGRTKVWVIREYGLPVRIELYAKSPKPSMSVVFTELKVNAGVGSADMRLDAPPGTRRVVVTADLADPEWEKKMDEELKRALGEATTSAKPAGQ